jgi:geranylgeranyl reductase family protein
MSAFDTDVLVVGAGPAGSAFAAAAASAGRDVLLIDAAAHPRPKACAEYASPRILEELRAIGLDDADWQADALPISGMRVIRGDDASDIRSHDAAGARPAWGLDRLAFDALLADHAAARGARYRERTSLRGLELDGAGITATLRSPHGPERVRARWVIGADGARSSTARLLGVDRPVRMPRRLGLVAHYEGIDALRDRGEMHVGPAGYIGLAPLAHGRLNVGMALPLDGTRRSAEERFSAAIASIPAVADRLRGVRRLTPIRGAAPIGHRVARAAGPGWLLVGDAAGFIDPFSGEGIFRALRSARAAATALAAGDRGVEDRYLAARRTAFAGKDALTWVVQAMLAAQPLLGYALRRLDRRPALADRFGSALGDCRPASDALAPAYLLQLLRP